MIRGDIFWANFGLSEGSEPGFLRPVLVIQSDAFNRSNINTTLVVPFTTNLELEKAPSNVLVFMENSGLPKDSVVVVSNLSFIDKQRLKSKQGRLAFEDMLEVEQGIRLVLGYDF
jgi:mRNA interferase MazF